MEGDYSSAAINTGSGAVVLCQHPAAMGGEGRWVLPVSTVTPPPPPTPRQHWAHTARIEAGEWQPPW